MFINFTQNQITNIRNEVFPAPEASTNSTFYISQITINSLGSSYDEGSTLTCDFFVTIRDELSKPKIFREEKAKKFMKLRVFQILSSEMQNKLAGIPNIFALDDLLNKYGSKYVDMNAGVAFFGSKNDVNEHYVEYTSEQDTTGIVHLRYKNSLFFNKNNFGDTPNLNNISYFGLGAVLFYDIREYIKENEILEQFSFKDTFISNIAIYDLIVNGDNVRPQILRDLRVVNTTFLQNSSLNRLINEQNKLGILTKKPTDKNSEKVNSFFSNLYLSKVFGVVNGEKKIYASGFFDIDFNSMIYENSPYKRYFKNLSFDTFLSLQRYSEIKSINILRKKIKKYKNTNSVKIINDLYGFKTIISSGESNEQYSISTIDAYEGYIEEIQKNNGELANRLAYRTIHFLDKNIGNENNGTYQYGLQIQYVDRLKQYVINNIIPNLRSSLINLKLYLNETNNFIKTSNYTRALNSNLLYNISLKNGYYDTLTDRFTYAFSNDANGPYRQKYSISNRVAILNYLSAASFFGLLKEEIIVDQKTGQTKIISYENDVLESLNNLLNPDFANIQSISYCVQVFEKLINMLQNIINSTGSSNCTIDYWFNNEYYEIDTQLYRSKSDKLMPSRGYKFLPDINDNKLQADDLKAVFERNVDSYIVDSSKDIVLKNDTVKICLGPSSIYNKENSLDISLESRENILTYPSPIFSNLEESIKKEKMFNYSTNEYYKDNGDDIEKNRQKFSDLLSNYSITISKPLYTQDEKTDLENNLYFIENKDKLQPYLINNILLKSINTNNKKFNLSSKTQKNPFSTITRNLPNNNQDFRQFLITNRSELQKYVLQSSFQVFSIISLKNILFNRDNSNTTNNDPRNFVKNIIQNSKYNLLFGTIHKVQYLEYNSVQTKNMIKADNWKDLDVATLNQILSFPDSVPVLCRLISADLDGIYTDVSMPIFNKYFLLIAGDLKTNVARDVPELTIENIEFENKILDFTADGNFISEETFNYIPQLFTGDTTSSVAIKSTPRVTIPERFDLEGALQFGERFGLDLDAGTRFGFLDTSKIDILKTPQGSFTTPRYVDGATELLGTPKIPNESLGSGVEAQPSSTPENPISVPTGLGRTSAGGGKVGASIKEGVKGQVKGGGKNFSNIGNSNLPPGIFGGNSGPFNGGDGGFGGNNPPPGGFP